jgi:hypothetical protein
MTEKSRIWAPHHLVFCLLVLWHVPAIRGDDPATLRLQVDELSPLLAHYAVRLSPLEVLCFNQDVEKFRQTADRLAKEGVTPEICAIAQGCRQNLDDIDSLMVLWEELRRDTPAPESQFWKLQQQVWKASALGAFQTDVTEYSNGVPTRSYTTDSTLTVAAGAAVVGMALDRVARQKHVASEIKRKQSVASRLGKLGDAVEQRRLGLQQKLWTQGYVPFAGPRKVEPILKARVATVDEKGTPIEEWEKERRRTAEIEEQVRAGEPLPQGGRIVSGPQLRLRNSGPNLHRVALQIDYRHYRHPDAFVVRQTYFIPEWPAGHDIEIIDEFRLNAANRADSDLFEEVLSPNEGLGMRVMPGFQGVIELTYSLSSDEMSQGPISLSLDEQRQKLAHNCLYIAEHWAWMLTQGHGPRGPLKNLPEQQRGAIRKLMTETSKKFAKTALELKSLNPADTKYAESIGKSTRAVADRTRKLEADVLQACQAGRVFSAEVTPQTEGYGFGPGIYDLTFAAEKATSDRIKARITRRATASSQEQTTEYSGQLIPATSSPGYLLQLTTARPSAANSPENVMAMRLSLSWKDSRWWYGNGPESFFQLTNGTSLAGNEPTGNVRLPIDSVWEGTRKFVDSRTGALLREETVVVTVRKSPRSQDTHEHFEGEFLIDGRFRRNGDIQLAVNGDIVLLPTTGRRGDPFHFPLRAKLNGDVIEGAVPAGSGKQETELVRLVKKRE